MKITGYIFLKETKGKNHFFSTQKWFKCCLYEN